MNSAANARWEMPSGDAGFPESMQFLGSACPECLYGLGSPEALSGPIIVVAGPCRASQYGLDVARLIGKAAGEQGVAVMTGGAFGCQAEAARACAAAGGTTIVFSGCGPDVAYPAKNTDVYEDALTTGGAVVSAEAWGTGPHRATFMRRTELMAATASAIFVAEAGNFMSSTCSLADSAMAQGKSVYTVPGPIFSPEAPRTSELISMGAQALADETSVRRALSLYAAPIADITTEAVRSQITELLRIEPMDIDDISISLMLPMPTIAEALRDLEGLGLIDSRPDGLFAPTCAIEGMPKTKTVETGRRRR